MKIDFGAAWKDLFSTPNKWMTLLGLSVCMLIPVVGHIVSLGYLVRRYARERNGFAKEDFDFGCFAEYLKTGLWPFLATFVLALVFIPLLFIAMVPMMLGPVMAQESEGLAIVAVLIGLVLYLAIMLLMTLFTYPILLRSGLTMDFKSGFKKSFIFSFIKKVGMSLLLWGILVGIVSFPLGIVGFLALIVGVYVVGALLQVVMFNLLFQHYDLYLHRGGEAVPVNPELIRDLSQPGVPQTSVAAPASELPPGPPPGAA